MGHGRLSILLFNVFDARERTHGDDDELVTLFDGVTALARDGVVVVDGPEGSASVPSILYGPFAAVLV